MNFNRDLAAIHAYLCADGYVIKNPESQKKKYYYIGFRNTNKKLLEDFQRKFQRYFRVKPRLILGERCIIQRKEIYEKLIKNFVSFYSRDWKMPKLKKKLIKIWLRSFFDCEGWVFCKSHQNRHIGLDTINETGLKQIIQTLNDLGINTIKKENKKRNMFRIFIYGKENLTKFKKEIGFLHSKKAEKLNEALRDYIIYRWVFPRVENKCKKFVKEIMLKKCRIERGKHIRIISKEEQNLKKLKTLLKKFYNINPLVYKRINGIGTIYYEMKINKKEEVKKLIKLKMIPNIFKQKGL